MFIKDIIIDGFKSYAQRTEIKNFDPQFNAITGLNGSGKSNILDSICFVLGITNLSQVRVNSLQELIYKNAQAGITKATVSVIFDNSAKFQSPIGYENCDEIIITRQIIAGGKNKYLINGYNATNHRVNDLFRSVNLNVNNPHFLIMQGRITKVLNMKPPEILSLIEETVGTKLYDTKRNAAIKVIEKKDAKLEDIHKVVKEEIMPLLNKLNKDKSAFLDYQKVNQDLEHFGKIYTAYLHWDGTATIQNLNTKFDEANGKLDEVVKVVEEKDRSIAALDEIIVDLEHKLGKERGDILEKIESALSDAQKEESKKDTMYRNALDNLKIERKKIDEVDNAINEEESSVDNKTSAKSKMGNPIEDLEKEFAQIQTSYTNAQNRLQACSTGLCATSEDGVSATLTQQLISYKGKMADLETEKEQVEMRLAHARTVLTGGEGEEKSKRKSGKGTSAGFGGEEGEQEYKGNLVTFQGIQKTINNLQAELPTLSYDNLGHEKELEDNSLLKRMDTYEGVIRALQNGVTLKEESCPSLRFEYGNWERGGDATFSPPFTSFTPEGRDASPVKKGGATLGEKIRGPIVSQIEGVVDHKYIRALEVTAGARMNFVVVDTEQVGKTLLQRGNLKRRTTFVPLNKISAKGLRPEIVKRAVDIGGGRSKVRPALEMLKFPESVRSAMEFVFGSTFICEDMETAKKVTFHPDIQQRCVTLEGDVFEPSGTISGGYHSPSTFSPLTKWLEILESKNRLRETVKQKVTLEPQADKINTQRARFQEVTRVLDLKTREASLLEFKIKNNPFNQAREDAENTKKLIAEEQAKLKETVERIKKVSSEIKDVETKLKNADSYQEAQTKAAKQDVDRIRKQYERVEDRLRTTRLDADKIGIHIEEMKRNLVALRLQKEGMEAQILKSQEYLERYRSDVDDVKERVKSLNVDLLAEKEAMRLDSREISVKRNQKKVVLQEKNDGTLRLQKLRQDLQTIEGNVRHHEERLSQLVREHKWIKEESLYFGKPNTIYNFKDMDMTGMEANLKKMKEDKQSLSRKVNNKALVMLEHVEEKYKELMNKKVTLLADKKQIEEVITELDEKKSSTLRKAHEQVTRDFGSIFSTLLPGAASKIVAPEGQTILQGLEIKVSFNNVWKDSLSELSGGQRSLIALALILSLLLFKPAPIYILDEIDAALDASHTQNIGIMLSQHFKTSQFVVVSLKDGMFQNANVLFKTSLVEGKSTVARYTKSSNKDVKN